MVKLPVPFNVKFVIVCVPIIISPFVPGLEIITLSFAPGTPFGDQLVAVPHEVFVVPVQVYVVGGGGTTIFTIRSIVTPNVPE